MDRDMERKAGKVMGIGGSIFAVAFMLFWCAMCAAMGAWFMLIFGVPMLGFMIFRLAVILRKSKEKPADPWDRPAEPADYTSQRRTAASFCPYCGIKTEESFEFCPKCGRRLS